MRILLVDFYDSFTFNLLHYLELLNADIQVVRNDDAISEDFVNGFSHVVLSPGPGLPSEKKNLSKILSLCAGNTPVLGICLGMQAIGEHLGGTLVNMGAVKHGVSERLSVEKDSILFKRLPDSFEVGLYHSWKIQGLKEEYITARLENGTIMALADDSQMLYGVQFHPESILSEWGKELLYNFINLT